MVEKTPLLDFFTYAFLMLGILIVGFPIIYSLIAATQTLEDVSKIPMPFMPGNQFFINMKEAWTRGDLGTQILNSFIMASGITVGKIGVSMIGAFSIVYFDYRFRKIAF
ncbi:MAG: ABC transporter permease, partial [Proteobacteria bacterium]|nr:ABC transporter permease [Pseudomonadota bacterium]